MLNKQLSSQAVNPTVRHADCLDLQEKDIKMRWPTDQLFC